MVDDGVVEWNTRFDSQLWRMNCQTFSTGFNSGHSAGSGRIVMFGGATR